MLHDVADYDKAFQVLSTQKKLSLGLWIISYHHEMGKMKAKEDVIIAVIRESIRICDYEHIFNLKNKYDFTLKRLSPLFIDFIIDSLLSEPYYFEIKLYLLDCYLDTLTADKALRVLQVFHDLFEQIEKSSHNIWMSNIHIGPISLTILDIGLKIGEKFSHL